MSGRVFSHIPKENRHTPNPPTNTSLWTERRLALVIRDTRSRSYGKLPEGLGPVRDGEGLGLLLLRSSLESCQCGFSRRPLLLMLKCNQTPTGDLGYTLLVAPPLLKCYLCPKKCKAISGFSKPLLATTMVESSIQIYDSEAAAVDKNFARRERKCLCAPPPQALSSSSIFLVFQNSMLRFEDAKKVLSQKLSYCVTQT